MTNGSKPVAYDIIGDIHGYARTLEALLTTLGYQRTDGVWRHPQRTAIFLGDFIDRGPHQRDVIGIVRPMIDSQIALAVMGNHEFNAIGYATPRPEGGFLRPHSPKNYKQHKEFLDAFADVDDYHEIVAWFRRLPLWLDLDAGIRVVHACWDDGHMKAITDGYRRSDCLTDDVMRDNSATPDTWEFRAVETLLKGKEIPLPPGRTIEDKEGTLRLEMRVRWWDAKARTYKEAFFGPESVRTHIHDDEIIGAHAVFYSPDDPPVFMGHYWLDGTPKPLADNIACLDYSVAKPGGKLVAYRWNGEKRLSAENFVAVNVAD